MNNSQYLAESSICRTIEDKLDWTLWRREITIRGSAPYKKIKLMHYNKKIDCLRTNIIKKEAIK